MPSKLKCAGQRAFATATRLGTDHACITVRNPRDYQDKTMTLDQAVSISADSVATLRLCDVYRVIDSCDQASRARIVRELSAARPDLSAEAYECSGIIASEASHAACSAL